MVQPAVSCSSRLFFSVLLEREHWDEIEYMLDISKAYDRVEWRFLHDMIVQLGFHTDWIGLIMERISSVS